MAHDPVTAPAEISIPRLKLSQQHQSLDGGQGRTVDPEAMVPHGVLAPH
jgi:hypothetical protein